MSRTTRCGRTWAPTGHLPQICLPPTSIYSRTRNPQAKSHQYIELANSIVDALPQEEVPRVRIIVALLVFPFLS